MYYYAPDDNRKGKRTGLLVAVCYLAAFLAASLLVTFHTDYESPAQGILVDFGDDNDGSGTQNVALSEAEEPPVAPPLRRRSTSHRKSKRPPPWSADGSNNRNPTPPPRPTGRSTDAPSFRAGAPPPTPPRRARVRRPTATADTNRAAKAPPRGRERATKASLST